MFATCVTTDIKPSPHPHTEAFQNIYKIWKNIFKHYSSKPLVTTEMPWLILANHNFLIRMAIPAPSIMSCPNTPPRITTPHPVLGCHAGAHSDYHHPPPRSTLSARQQSHRSDGTWQRSPCPWFCLLREHQPHLQNMPRQQPLRFWWFCGQNPDNCPAEIDFTSKAWLLHHISGKLESLLRMTPVSSHQQARVRGHLTRHCWKNGLMLGGAGTSSKTENWSDSPTGCDLITLTGIKFKPPAGEGYFLCFQNLHIFESKHGWNFGLICVFLK